MKLPLLAGGVVSVLVAMMGCGGDEDLPSNAVAKVGDTVIGVADFDKQLARTAHGETGSDLERLRTQAMEILIQRVWVRRAADELGVTVTPAQARRELERQKDRAFDTPSEYSEFLQASGRTEADILVEVETTLRQRELSDRVTAGKLEVSEAETRAYYARSKDKLVEPARRSLGRVIPATAPSLESMRAQIVKTLKEQRQQRLLDEFAQDFREEYRSQTVCADEYRVASCANGPARN